jgi:ABC-type uncharacterized transport system substrate-binding protein
MVEGVEVTWRYDELYSLLVLEDMGLDDDFDGKLTQVEMAELDGFDLKWIEGFEGDLYATSAEGKLALGPPKNRGTSIEKGQIVSRHFRSLERSAKTLSLKAFDPTYYTAYDLGLGIDLPEGCEAKVIKADLDAAKRLEAELLGDDVDNPEADYPEVGEEFADEIIVTCVPAS